MIKLMVDIEDGDTMLTSMEIRANGIITGLSKYIGKSATVIIWGEGKGDVGV